MLEVIKRCIRFQLYTENDHDFLKHDVLLDLNYESCFRTVGASLNENLCMHLYWSRTNRSISPNPANNTFFDFGNGVKL